MGICVRAVDGGGDGFRRADIWGTGEVVNLKTRPPVSSVGELLDFTCEELPAETVGIAFALAGVIENHNRVVKSPNIHLLDNEPLGELTLIRKRLPTTVCNDMEAAVTGMSSLAPAYKRFMGITWSSGIGLRFWDNGEILADSEGGHIPLDLSPFAPLCGCGRRGCAEAIIGGMAIKRRVIAEAEALKIEIPADIDPCKFLDACFDEQQEWAMKIYGLVTEGMGAFLATIYSLLRIETVIWKGTFGICALHRIEQSIRHAMARRLITPESATSQAWLFSPQPKVDGLLGAAAILRKNLEKK